MTRANIICPLVRSRYVLLPPLEEQETEVVRVGGDACLPPMGSTPPRSSPPRQITIIMIRAHERARGAVGESRRMKSPQYESKVVKEHTPKIEVSVS